MQRTKLDRNVLKVEKFIDAAGEADLALVMEGFGINAERLTELGQMVSEVKTARLRSDLQLARQKELTAQKDALKSALQEEITRLSDLIRSQYPKAPWLSSLGLETRYATVVAKPAATETGETGQGQTGETGEAQTGEGQNGEGQNGEGQTNEPQTGEPQARRRAVRRKQTEAALRGTWSQLLENIVELNESVGLFLAGRGWTGERIANLKTMFDAYATASEARDSAMRITRARSAELAEAVEALETRYRSYTRQIRTESGSDPLGQKLKSAATALS